MAAVFSNKLSSLAPSPVRLRQDNYVYGAGDLLFESWGRKKKQIPAQQEQIIADLGCYAAARGMTVFRERFGR